MERVNQILSHPLFKMCIREIRVYEAKRIFCGHDVDHLMDVARLMWIFNLEQHLDIEKERIYGAALLHDIGRHLQYREGTPHQLAGIPIAEQILKDCGFVENEVKDILHAIENHRNGEMKEEKSLAGILYCADKMSRDCFGCKAQAECNWPEEKKNLKIVY